MADEKSRNRAQFLLSSILAETRSAFAYLYRKKPRIFARGLAKTIVNHDRLEEVIAKLNEVTPVVESGKALDWDALEDVGLTGEMLEWKADLLYESLGKRKPAQDRTNVSPQEDVLSYPEGKPVWSRLFKYLKSLFQSLINAVTGNDKVRLALDFVREFIDCVEASFKFVQSSPEAA